MDTVGNYNIIREFKVDGPGGGQSTLYLAYRRGPQGLRSKVLLKRQTVESPELLDSFLTEARLGYRLVHPNIARVIDVFEDGGQLWLAMEYIEGANVHQLWAADRERAQRRVAPRLTIDMMVWMIMQGAEALDFAHELPIDGQHAGIVHRDVTPDNLVVSGTGNTFLIDFGIALAEVEGRQRTASNIIKGKTGYMSPETLNGKRADRRTDVYGLGIVLTELLTGEKAFPQETKEAKFVQIMLGDLPPIRSKNPDVPDELAQFVEQMRHVDRDKRIQTARDVYDGLYRVRPSSVAPEVKRQLGAIAVGMSAPGRTKSSPFYRSPVVRTLVLPSADRRDESPAPMAPSEQNAPQYVESKAGVIDAETHKLDGDKIVSLVLAPPPPAPMVLMRYENEITHQDRRQLHGRPTVKLPAERTRELSAHIARGSFRPRSTMRIVFAAFVCVVVATAIVVGALKAVARKTETAERDVDEPPKLAAQPIEEKHPLVVSAVLPAASSVASSQALPPPAPVHHHRKKAAVVGLLPVTSAGSAQAAHGAVAKVVDESGAGVGIISVAANDREVRFVFVDKVYIGNAPRDYEVAPGKHHVVVTANENGVPVQRASEWVVVNVGDHHLVGAR